MSEHLLLKWGTLKGWEVESDAAKRALQRYADEPVAMGAMQQRDTPAQKLALCDLIDAVSGEIQNDWSGDMMTKDEAKKYVMEVRHDPLPDMPASGMSAEPTGWLYRLKVHPTAPWLFVPGMWPDNWGLDAWERLPLYTADSLTQELAAKDKEIEGLRAVELHARAMTKALTGLTANGSEFFVRVGESYYADTERCVTYVRDRHARTHTMLVEAVTARKDAEAHLTAALAGLDAEGKSNWIARDKLAACEAQLTALKSLVAEAAKAIDPLIQRYVVIASQDGQTPSASAMVTARHLAALAPIYTRLNEAVKP